MMRPESPARRRSVEVQSPPQLQVTGEGLHSSTPAWVTRLSRPSTAPALRAAWALSPGSRGEPDIPEPPPPDSRRSTQERSSRRSGVPSWVDRLANKPSRGRAASPARATLDAPTSRPESAASRSRSSQAASVSGRPPSRQTAWDAEAIKESLARLRAARSSTCSEHSASSKDFRIPAIRRGDDSAREAAVSQQAACRAAQESSHSSADENAAVIQPRSNQPVKPKPEDSAAQAHHRAASADHFPRPALLQPAPLPPGYRPAERRSETATPVPTFRHPAAAGTAHNNVFAVSHVALQQPEVTPLGPRKPSGILSTEAQVVPQQQQQHPAAPSQRADARPATAGPKLEHQPAADCPQDLPGYTLGQVVGVGGFCQVRLATHTASGRVVAVKIVEKHQVMKEQNMQWRVGREIGILKHMKHPRINALQGVIDTPDRLFILLQFLPNGSLLDRVRKQKRIAEAEASRLLRQSAEGLQHCHEQHCVHRDIKLENLLLDSKDAVQVIDFGLAAVWTPGKLLRMHCGSPSYAAPEIVARKLYEGPPVDVWSLGVVLHAMLVGRLPFVGTKGDKQDLCRKILAANFTIPDHVSPAARDLLLRMLTVDPTRRITLPEVLQHSWVKAEGAADSL